MTVLPNTSCVNSSSSPVGEASRVIRGRLPQLITQRWITLRHHDEQSRLWTSPSRFRVVPAGRRSGKTELAKRYLVKMALSHTKWMDAWYVAAAPTLQQARRIYWRDLKALVPKWALAGKPQESLLTIPLINGAEITVLGMDTPERIEGRSLDGVVLDEYGNMKPRVWDEHVRPALADRQGWAWFIGVPEGRNHYFKTSVRAAQHAAKAYAEGRVPIWDNFHWFSADILAQSEIDLAKAEMDPLTYAQEFEGAFINFEGRAYYAFTRQVHAAERLHYDPSLPLIFCFDFNVAPGVAVVLQEQDYKGHAPHICRDEPITMCIGEVYIPRNSNTEVVCRKLVKDWGHHEGFVYIYGDATGGARGTAKVAGSDWAIVERCLRAADAFGPRVKMRVKKRNPKERERINATNSRIMSTDRTVRCLVDANNTEHLQLDFEGVTLLEGGSGEIDKHASDELTHISDAIGYYFESRFPISGGHRTVVEEY